MNHFILADNQDLTRIGLEHILLQSGSCHISRAEDKAELLEQLKADSVSVVFLDYTLFDFSGIESLLIVSERFSNVHWILISDDLTDKFMRSIIYSSHRISIIFKDSPLNVIRDAITASLQGSRYICQRATEILLEQQKEDLPAGLTPTEIEILKAIAQGKTTKEIAAERFSSVHTVNTHRKNIFRKLKVNTAHEAVKYAFRAGLVDTSEFYI